MHVLDRFRKAASISIDSITVDSPGMFRVCKGADRGNTNVSANGAYRVCFGDDSSLPSCECEDWLRHYRPCKHMCAIFHQFPEHSWDSLSHLYSGNVIFKLDETLVSENDMNTRDAGQCVTDVIFSNNHDHDTVNDETNSESETERTAGVCRELLKQCMDFTYLCTEQQPLRDLLNVLQQFLSNVSRGIPNEDGLPLDKTMSSSHLRLKHAGLKELPKRRRLGKKQGKGKLQQRPGRKVKSILKRPHSTETTHHSAVKRVRFEQTCVSDSVVIDDEPTTTSACLEYRFDDDIQVLLYKENVTNIAGQNELNDIEVSAGLALLKHQFPNIGGLKDTCTVVGHITEPITGEFIQVVNSSRHWVTVSTLGAPGDCVFVYDSVFAAPARSVMEVSCRMLMSANKSVTFVNKPTQKQIGAVDCGLFSLAFCTSLVFGQDPVHVSYDQSTLRAHFLSCLKQGRMTPFPETENDVIRHKQLRSKAVKIFCVCRVPNDNTVYIQCANCREWYHPQCVNLPLDQVHPRHKWMCHKCVF